MNHEIIPYSCQTIEEADIQAVEAVMRAPFLTQGPAIGAFEQEFAKVHGFEQAVAVCNATAALHLACLALGVGPGDWVWTSPNSFVASANCALYCGAQVDFVDIDPRTRNICVKQLEKKLEEARRRGNLPKVVIPVDFAGLPADLPVISELARKYEFRIIEDASHAVGAMLNGLPVGSGHADIAVFSFHAVKIITTAEGGMCATQDAALAHKLRLLRSHGITRDPRDMIGEAQGSWSYEQVCLGYNYRITDLQAALGNSQLKRLPELFARREALARRYDILLRDLPLILPAREPGLQSAHHLYVVEIDEGESNVDRRSAFENLRRLGIGVNVHYIPIHLQPYYRSLGFQPGDFPASEHYYSRAITIPLYPKMTNEQQDEVVAALRQTFGP